MVVYYDGDVPRIYNTDNSPATDMKLFMYKSGLLLEGVGLGMVVVGVCMTVYGYFAFRRSG